MTGDTKDVELRDSFQRAALGRGPMASKVGKRGGGEINGGYQDEA